MTKAEKALCACREYDRLATEIRNDTDVIANASCDRILTNEDGVDFIPDGGKTHLHEVFQGYDCDDGYFAPMRAHYHRDEALEIIGECEGCRQAYEAIQRRKANRKKLGAVKRAIRLIARVQGGAA